MLWRVAVNTTLSLVSVMIAFFLVKVAVHPASHSWPTDTRVASSSGSILVSVAVGGRSYGRLPVSVLFKSDPSGNFTCTGLASVLLFWIEASE